MAVTWMCAAGEALFKQAAELGDVAAMYALGERCRYGDGVEVDWTMAAVWFRKAADEGYGYYPREAGRSIRDLQAAL
jgi:TPR repeat protein